MALRLEKPAPYFLAIGMLLLIFALSGGLELIGNKYTLGVFVIIGWLLNLNAIYYIYKPKEKLSFEIECAENYKNYYSVIITIWSGILIILSYKSICS